MEISDLHKTTIRTCRVSLACICVALWAGSAANAAVPTPSVTLSPEGTHGFPFSSSALDLTSAGFVEQEFLISGTAQAYINEGALGTDGKWNVKPNPGVTSAYTTRLLVRRPTNPKRFNGTVLVEWNNVSGGVDATPDWALAHEEILREGYAWVGVSAQFVGVLAQQQWENGPQDRYAAVFHPGDSFSYDIFSQAAKAIRAPGAIKPLGALTQRVRSVLADGESQSAGRMITYYNAIQPLANVYDGFIIHSNGAGAALSQSFAGMIPFPSQAIPAPNGVPATPDIPVPPTAFLRGDIAAPVLFVNTESDVGPALGGGFSVHQQPDSLRFRLWEVAGTSHADQYLLATARADSVKSGGGQSPECGNPPINNGPGNYSMNAAIHALRLWVEVGVVPATAARFNMTISPSTVQATINRDPATGLAIGGLRLPQIAVPTSTHTGERPLGALAASPFCFLFGASDPWNGDSDAWDGQAGFDPSPTPEPTLSASYRNRGDYVSKVVASAWHSVLRGHLRPVDALQIIRDAAHAPVPR